MRYISCLLLVFLLGCRVDNEDTLGPERSVNAIIFDSSMYMDGCELHLQLSTGTTSNTRTQYKFAPASVPLVQRILAEATLDPKQHVDLPVSIRFQETATKSVLACGWVSPTVTEINVLAIDRR
jgi:hypothetical protein